LRKHVQHVLPFSNCHAKAAAAIIQASRMGDKSDRVEGTLKSLFESLIPPQFPDEDDEDADDRIERAIELGRNIVDSRSGYPPADVNQAQDLIKRKLLRENASPEKAARFSNLYSRLLSIPVLNQKWSILYLLYKLSEQDAPPEHLRRPLLESDQLENIVRREEVTRRKESKHLETRRFSPEASRPAPEKIATSSPSKVRPQRATSSAQPRGLEDDNVNGTGGNEEKDNKLPPSETALLRDLPFNLQGLSSTSFVFTSPTSVKLPADVPIPVLSLLNTLAEPCLLYRGLSDFIQTSEGGLVGQSLRAAIGTELRSYLSLVATLEGEIRRALTAIEKQDEKQGIRKAGVTLKRCVIWTRDATMGLRLMTLVIEESKQHRGGQLISLIHGFSSSHGDPFVSTFAERLLAHVTRPFYDMLRRWIYDGELIDPYHEFFVTEPDPSLRPDVDPRRVATSVWDNKYQLDNAMVPSIISAEFAKKIFLIGKSLNFIRHNCGDSDWVIGYSKSASKELHYGDTAGLEASIDEAYKSTMSRLIHLMSEKYNLFTHLKAIKRYLLLSQGDFIALLMESLAPNLDRPANSQYRHTLTSQLEHAIRHSNAQFDNAEVLSRLDARMVEFSSGDTGWECFTLEYKISAPCDVVITQWASTQYLKVFNLLWRIKRVEFSLSSTWRRCMTGSRGVLAAVEDKVGSDWKRARCVIAEMVHFVNQLQYYILFEVVEASWDQLENAMNKPDSTLDELIEAHTKYLNSITHKGLLGSQRHHSTGQREDSFLTQLYYILKNMLAYKDVVDGLYSFSVAEFTRRQEFSAKIEHRTAQGKWGITEKDLVSESSRTSTPTPVPSARPLKHNTFVSDEIDSPFAAPVGLTGGGDDKTLLASLRARLLQLSADFKSKVNVLLYDLAHQPDVDMRFLGVVMNFNEVYKPVNIRRQAARKEREKRELERKSREVSAMTVDDGNESKRSER
jgi:gamma-tubulin complex component 3